jgi:hypothetical protein
MEEEEDANNPYSLEQTKRAASLMGWAFSSITKKVRAFARLLGLASLVSNAVILVLLCLCSVTTQWY